MKVVLPFISTWLTISINVRLLIVTSNPLILRSTNDNNMSHASNFPHKKVGTVRADQAQEKEGQNYSWIIDEYLEYVHRPPYTWPFHGDIRAGLSLASEKMTGIIGNHSLFFFFWKWMEWIGGRWCMLAWGHITLGKKFS